MISLLRTYFFQFCFSLVHRAIKENQQILAPLRNKWMHTYYHRYYYDFNISATRTCIAHGDVNYQTFDGKNFEFQGSLSSCTYVMSKLCESDEFQVLVKHETSPDGEFLRSVTVVLGNHVSNI